MKRNIKGISLIVLVITIIVMTILAGTIVLTLSNTNIMDKAEEAVDKNNLSEVQQLAAILWSEAYLDSNGQATEAELNEAVIDGLEAQKINTDDYRIKVTKTGVSVESKYTLGALIDSAADYGKTVNYSANGVTNWKLFYHTDEYVYLIASQVLPDESIPNIDYTEVNNGSFGWVMPESDWYVMGTIQNPSMWMFSGKLGNNEYAISHLLDESYWNAFKNTQVYGNNVIGAIGTPTVELFVASWNAKGNALKDTTTYVPLELTETWEDSSALILNEDSISIKDKLYVMELDSSIWLAGNYYTSDSENLITLGSNGVFNNKFMRNSQCYLRPVICLKASTPARLGTASDTTDIVLK